jgi:hypothetical protein
VVRDRPGGLCAFTLHRACWFGRQAQGFRLAYLRK